MGARLNWFQNYKNIDCDLIIFSDEMTFSGFRKSKKKWIRKEEIYKSLKLVKVIIKWINTRDAITRTEKV